MGVRSRKNPLLQQRVFLFLIEARRCGAIRLGGYLEKEPPAGEPNKQQQKEKKMTGVPVIFFFASSI